MHKDSQPTSASAPKKGGPANSPVTSIPRPAAPISAANPNVQSPKEGTTLPVGVKPHIPGDPQLSESENPQLGTIKVSPYQLYVQARQQRETKLFLTLGGAMGIALVLSIFVFFGLLRIPFLEGFKEPPKYAMSGSIPCPLSDTPVAADQLKVRVLNASDQKGLAKQVAKQLSDLKIKVTSVGNSNEKNMNYDARIITGPTGVNGAYTLARAFSDVEIIMDTRQSTDLTLILGPDFEKVRTTEEFKAEARQPLEALDKCVPVRLT